MMKKSDLIRSYNRVCRLLNELCCAQQNLSKNASEYTGLNLHADITAGEEIEFRKIQLQSGTEIIDSFSTFRINDILNMKGGEV